MPLQKSEQFQHICLGYVQENLYLKIGELLIEKHTHMSQADRLPFPSNRYFSKSIPLSSTSLSCSPRHN